MKTIKVKTYKEIPKNYTGIVEYFDGTKGWYINDKLHREEGPCTTCKDCLKGNFVLCTKPGPAIERPDGTKEWYINDKLHREDGPAIEQPDGTKKWWLNNKLHREEGPCTTCKDCLKGNFVLCTKPGPALERADGTKYWYSNGKPHREDGPAMICSDGHKEWYLNGERVNKKIIELHYMLKHKKTIEL